MYCVKYVNNLSLVLWYFSYDYDYDMNSEYGSWKPQRDRIEEEMQSCIHEMKQLRIINEPLTILLGLVLLLGSIFLHLKYVNTATLSSLPFQPIWMLFALDMPCLNSIYTSYKWLDRTDERTAGRWTQEGRHSMDI